MLQREKIIIGVHGLGNKPSATILAGWWEKSLLEGLRIRGFKRKNVPFELVYWSDVLHPQPTDPSITDEHDPLYVDHPYQAAINLIPKPRPTVRQKVLDYLELVMDKIFLNADGSLNFGSITDRLIHRYFRDLDSYYQAPDLDPAKRERFTRDQIRHRLVAALNKHRNKEIFLISHSMGSIVAFDVLYQELTKVAIDTLVTIGSPLGIPAVIGKILTEKHGVKPASQLITTPELVTRAWYNLSDLDDRIAMNYNLADDYGANSRRIQPIDFIVSNNYEFQGQKNSHSSFGYLRTPEMADIVNNFLKRPAPSLIGELFRNLKNRLLKF